MNHKNVLSSVQKTKTSLLVLNNYHYSLFIILTENVLGFECLFHSELTSADREGFQKLFGRLNKLNVITELKMWKIKLISSCDNVI